MFHFEVLDYSPRTFGSVPIGVPFLLELNIFQNSKVFLLHFSLLGQAPSIFNGVLIEVPLYNFQVFVIKILPQQCFCFICILCGASFRCANQSALLEVNLIYL